MDCNVLELSIKKFVTRGFYEQHYDLPKIIKNAKLLYRDQLQAHHIVMMAELYNQYQQQNFVSRLINASILKAFEPSADGEPPLYLAEVNKACIDCAKGHFCSSNDSDFKGGDSLEEESEQLHF